MMAAGALLLTSDGRRILRSGGKRMLSDGAGNDCCCGCGFCVKGQYRLSLVDAVAMHKSCQADDGTWYSILPANLDVVAVMDRTVKTDTNCAWVSGDLGIGITEVRDDLWQLVVPQPAITIVAELTFDKVEIGGVPMVRTIASVGTIRSIDTGYVWFQGQVLLDACATLAPWQGLNVDVFGVGGRGLLSPV